MARGRKSTGTVKWRYSAELGREVWMARYTRGVDKSRTPWAALPETIAREDEAGARAFAVKYAALAKHSTKDGTGETLGAYALRWLASRAPRTAKDNRSHIEHHVEAVIGYVPMQHLTSTHGDELVAALDEKIKDGTISAKTAKNVWGTVGRMLRDAAHAKPHTGLRCLEANPFRDVQPPERSRTKQALNFLYPSELLALLSHPRVPAHWKRNVSIAVFLGLRDGEQRALRWEHVDLEHSVITVCETFDKHAKAVREGTKTGVARIVPVPPSLLPLLSQMHDDADGDGLVCRGIASPRAMARGLRTWLRVSGVTRSVLQQTTSVNRALRWHDLRATCGTWLACIGRSAPEIRDVLGHTQTAMTDKYLRNATIVRGGSFGEAFPALPPIGRQFRHESVLTEFEASNYAQSQALLRGGRDSNGIAPDHETACLPEPEPSEAARIPSRLVTPRDVPPPAATSRDTDPSEDLGSAIARITRLLGQCDDADTAAELVSERKVMRAELAKLQTPSNVVQIRQSAP
jgi:integrase